MHGSGTEMDIAECVEKVEAMVSTAVLHQEDVLEILTNLISFEGNRNVPDHGADRASAGDGRGNLHVSPRVVAAMKEKLESAMDWCRLAQCRLKALIPDEEPLVER